MDGGFEPRFHALEVGQVIVGAVALWSESRPRRHDHHVLREHALQLLQQLRVCA